MEQNEEKKGPERKSQIGRFQVSLWKTRRVFKARNDYEPEKQVISRRACIQYSRLNRQTQVWDNQQVWCNLDELRDLAQALDEVGQIGGDAE